MKVTPAWVLAAAILNLTACASLGIPGSAGDPPVRWIGVDGESYLVRQITDSTWTVSSSASRKILVSTPSATAKWRQAVEKTSGCKVTDSDYSAQGRQFDAQVDCPGALAR